VKGAAGEIPCQRLAAGPNFPSDCPGKPHETATRNSCRRIAGRRRAGHIARPADVVIAGGTVFSGDDAPPVHADVVLSGDKIVYVGAGAAKKYRAAKTIDAHGRIVAPGFIDGHSHPEHWLDSADPKDRALMPWITQGTATLLMGIEAEGTPDIADQTARYARAGIGPMQQSWMTTSSDAGSNHPRTYATMPQKFYKYAVQDKVITVQRFIRSATGLEADDLHLDRRGYLRPGYFADVVVFDPKAFRPRADYVHFDVPTIGVDALFSNGRLAADGLGWRAA
jgi:N-acyl-D-aspartate/D-glutamate deacylase